MNEEVLQDIAQGPVSDNDSEVAEVLQQGPVETAEALSPDQAEYFNSVNKETYGDGVESINTTEDVRRVNAEASINAAQEDWQASLTRSMQNVLRGTYQAGDVANEAIWSSYKVAQAEYMPDYGLAIENSRQLQTDAGINNPALLNEPESSTEYFNRVNTNKAMLGQAIKELGPGLLEYTAAGANVYAAVSTGDTKYLDNAKEITKYGSLFGLVDAIANDTGMFLVPMYTTYLRSFGAEFVGEKTLNPTTMEMVFYKFWDDAINNDTNEQFKEKLVNFRNFMADKGFTPQQMQMVLSSAIDPSPKLAMFEAVGDMLAVFSGLSKVAANFYEGMVAAKGAPKMKAVLAGLKNTFKDLSKVTPEDIEKAVADLEAEMRRAGILEEDILKADTADIRSLAQWNTTAPLEFSNNKVFMTPAEEFLAVKALTATSKVKDKAGKLIKVYHGSPYAKHDTFDYGKTNLNGLFGGGHYFTDNMDVASSYANESYTDFYRGVYSAYLNITKPFSMDTKASKKIYNTLFEKWRNSHGGKDFPEETILSDLQMKLFSRNAIDTLKVDNVTFEYLVDKGLTNADVYKVFDEFLDLTTLSDQARDAFLKDVYREAGYDGFKYIGGMRTGGKRHTAYVAFYDSQVYPVARQGGRVSTYVPAQVTSATKVNPKAYYAWKNSFTDYNKATKYIDKYVKDWYSTPYTYVKNEFYKVDQDLLMSLVYNDAPEEVLAFVKDNKRNILDLLATQETRASEATAESIGVVELLTRISNEKNLDYYQVLYGYIINKIIPDSVMLQKDYSKTKGPFTKLSQYFHDNASKKALARYQEMSKESYEGSISYSPSNSYMLSQGIDLTKTGTNDPALEAFMKDFIAKNIPQEVREVLTDMPGILYTLAVKERFKFRLKDISDPREFAEALEGFIIGDCVSSDLLMAVINKASAERLNAKAVAKAAQQGYKGTPLDIRGPVVFDNTYDFGSSIGRRLAARDEVGAANELVRLVKEGDTSNVGIIRTIAKNYFDSAMQVALTNKSISNMSQVLSEKDYQRALGGALNALQRVSRFGMEGRQQELLTDAVRSFADSLDAQNSLYRTSGVSDVLRTHYQDIMRTNDQGDLFGLVRLDKFFKDRKQAMDYAKKFKGPNADASVMPVRGGKDMSDGWAVDVRLKLNKGFGTLAKEASEGHQGWRAKLSSIFTTTSNPQWLRHINAIRENEVAHMREWGTSVQRAYRKIPSAEKDTMDALIAHGIEAGEWYTPELMKLKGFSKESVEAYNGYRMLNDMDYFIINRSRHDEMIRQGIKHLTLGDISWGYGRIKRDATAATLKDTNRLIVLNDIDATPARYVDLGLDDKTVEDLFSKGWVVVERGYGPNETLDAESVYYFVNGRSLIESDIPEFVTNYIAGGRRFFDRKNGYLRQLTFTETVGGKDVITGVQTIATDADSVGLTINAQKLEQIRVAVAKMYADGYVDNSAIAQLIEDLKLDAPFKNGDEFLEWAQAHHIDYKHLDNQLSVVKEGEVMPRYHELAAKYSSTLSEEDVVNNIHRSAYQAMTRESQMERWQRSGKDLLAYNLTDKADIADFDKIVQYMVQDMVNARVMGKFTDMYAEAFVKQFGDLVKERQGKTARQMLNSVRRLSDLERGGKRSWQALAAAKNYQAIRGIPTDLDAVLAKGFTDMMEAIGEDIPEELLGFKELGHKLRLGAHIFNEWKPLSKLRWTTSSRFLGMMNVKQAYTQLAPVMYTFAAAPKSTAKVVTYVGPLIHELLASRGSYSKAFERFIKNSGLKSDEIKGVWEALVNGRIFENTPMAGAFEGAGAASKLENFDRMQFAIKNWSEVANRVIAHAVAYEELGFGAKGINTAGDFAKWKSLGNSLYMNMDATGMARLQTTEGAKLATQFWSAQFRWWETVVFDKNLTRWQRARILAFAAGMTGLRGVLGANAARKSIDFVKDSFNFFSSDDEPARISDAEMSAVERSIETGLLGWYAGAHGYDFSGAFSLPLAEIFNDIGDLWTSPIKSIPAVESMTRDVQFIKDLITAVNIVRGSEDTYKGWHDAIRLIASSKGTPAGLKQPLAAALMYRDKMKWSAKGQLTVEDAKLVDVAMAAMGIPRIEQADLAVAYKTESNAREYLDNVAKELGVLFNIWKGSHNEGVWKQITYILNNADLTERERLYVKDKLINTTEYATVITDYKRKLLNELENGAVFGDYLIQLNNIERKQ